jgi:hypothetical protein
VTSFLGELYGRRVCSRLTCGWDSNVRYFRSAGGVPPARNTRSLRSGRNSNARYFRSADRIFPARNTRSMHTGLSARVKPCHDHPQSSIVKTCAKLCFVIILLCPYLPLSLARRSFPLLHSIRCADRTSCIGFPQQCENGSHPSRHRAASRGQDPNIRRSPLRRQWI